MVGNWRQRTESGVDTKEGAIKVSVLKAVLFLWRGLKPPVHCSFFFHVGPTGSEKFPSEGSNFRRINFTLRQKQRKIWVGIFLFYGVYQLRKGKLSENKEHHDDQWLVQIFRRPKTSEIS